MVAASGGCPCTIWPSTAVPSVADVGPDSPVELGVTFRADSNGYITGIRFYKSTGNTGTHVGNLWSSGGALLASATFTGESASGWQQVNFRSEEHTSELQSLTNLVCRLLLEKKKKKKRAK